MIIRLLFILTGLCFMQHGYGAFFAEQKPEVIFTGLDAALEKNAQAYLQINNESCDASIEKIDAFVKTSPGLIKQSLKALGYYHPEITSSLQQDEDCWQLTFTIKPGLPVKIKRIDINITGAGKEEKFYTDIIKNITLKSGDVLQHAQYEQLKNQLITVSTQYGYFDYVIVKHQLQVNVLLNQADFVIHFETGQRYYFGDISLQQTILEPDFVSKYITFASGEAYQREKVSKTHFALDGSGYFKQVQIKVDEKQAQAYHAPVTINMQALPRHKLAFGAGYDTDLGFRGNTDYTSRYVNRSGHRFISNLSASQRKSYVFMDYQIPLHNPAKQLLSFTSSFVYEDTENILSETYSVGVRYTQRFAKKQVLNTQLNFVAERFDSGNDEDKFKIMLVPGATWSNVITENKGFELQGFRYSLQIQGSDELIVSDVGFIQALFKFKFVHQFAWHGKLIMRTDLGAMAVSQFSELPTSYRFYSGGDNSVRGYKYKAIGAVDENGDVIGGKFLTVGSIEYEQLVYKQWSLAVFADAGDAFLDTINMRYGIGWGIRWYSIIGPVRLDMAFPSEDWQDFRFHFSFSTAL